MNEISDAIERWVSGPAFGRAVAVVVGLVVIIAIVRGLRRLLLNRVQDIDTSYRVRKAITFIGYLAAFFLLSTVFSEQFRNITFALGVTGDQSLCVDRLKRRQ